LFVTKKFLKRDGGRQALILSLVYILAVFVQGCSGPDGDEPAERLLISEVGSSYYRNTLRWFEVYNPTSTAQNLSQFELRSLALNESESVLVSSHTFSLPSATVRAGGFLILRAQTLTDYPQYAGEDTDYVVHIDDGLFRPYWANNGFLELLKVRGGGSVDFVTFGNNYEPTIIPSWEFPVTVMPSDVDDFGRSIGRDANMTDTNSASDWQLYDWPTLGGPNDVCGTDDADGDLIPDCNEQPGTTFSGMPLYEWGARAGQSDIFIEVDSIDSTNGGTLFLDEGVLPRKEALENVVAAFAAEGFSLHIDIGHLFDVNPSPNPSIRNMGGGEVIPYSSSIAFTPFNGQAGFYDYKKNYFNYRRSLLFHYAIFGTSAKADGTAGSGGMGEVMGNDFMVTAGGFGLNSTNAASENLLINYQSSAFMHELGDNLGLLHGGDEDLNDKPNYISTMNYTYVMDGLPDLDNNPGDRYYKVFALSCETALVDGSHDDPADFRLGFSNGTSIPLDVTNLDETKGLGRTSASVNDVVDYNCNGDLAETGVDVSATVGAALSAALLTDHDDWSNIILDFGAENVFSDLDQSPSLSRMQIQTNSILRFKHPINNDRGEYIIERPAPERFLRMIQNLKAKR
jgi:hypothetical protein